MHPTAPPVFRFAPSPNGPLHIGHVRSALLNRRLADEAGGLCLLRIDDVDTARARPEHEAALLADLDWLGIDFDGTPRRQSDHIAEYAAALGRLTAMGLTYPAFLSRREVRERSATGRTDPDGAAIYPGEERDWDANRLARAVARQPDHAIRLDMAKALALVETPLAWNEQGERVEADPGRWGDVALARSTGPASYHLSCVVDDAAQGVSHVVRGRDLHEATAVHRLLQTLLGLPEPHYHHHDLILDADGAKLSKSANAPGLRSLGMSPQEIRVAAFSRAEPATAAR